jgi:hypothetical protein
MSGCLEVKRSCRGVGALGRLVSVFASKLCQRLAIGVDRGSGLERFCVSESK